MIVYETKPRIQNIFKHEIRLHPFQSVLKFSSFWKFSKIMKFCTWTCNFSYDFSRASFKIYPCETPVWHKHGSCDSYKGVHVPFLWQIRNLELAFDQRSDSDVASDGRLHLRIKNVFKKSSNILKTNHFRIFFDFGIMSKVKWREKRLIYRKSRWSKLEWTWAIPRSIGFFDETSDFSKIFKTDYMSENQNFRIVIDYYVIVSYYVIMDFRLHIRIHRLRYGVKSVSGKYIMKIEKK